MITRQRPTAYLVPEGDGPDHLEREWRIREQAGQVSEIWQLGGGADLDHGYTIFWVPDEHVFWLFNCGLEPDWYYSPFTREFTFSCLGEVSWGRYFHRLPGYVPRSTRCEICDGALTEDDRDITALSAIEGGVWMPQCAACMRALYEEHDA